MMKREWTLLFSEYDLRAVLEGQLAKVSDAVLAVPEERFSRDSNDLIAASVASDLVVSPVQLHEDQVTVEAKDAKIDVRYDHNRAIFDRSRPFYIDGVEVTYHLPFSGEKVLFNCRPGTFTFNPPRAVIGTTDELTFPYDQADRQVAATKAMFQTDVDSIKQWLGWVNGQVTEYNQSLEEKARGHVLKRRQELDKRRQDLSSLGYPAHKPAPSKPKAGNQPTDAPTRRRTMRERKRRTYDVALSFAGQDREYVESVAEELKSLDVTVFYDRFEQVELWGKDLAEHLGHVYSEDAHFVVLFASQQYAERAWPNHEKQFALGRHLRGQTGRLLPVRLDDTAIPGLPTTIGYLDARVLTPAKLAELIRQKVDSETSDV